MGNCVTGSNERVHSGAANLGVYKPKNSSVSNNGNISNTCAENATIESSAKESVNNNENKPKESKVIVSDQNEQIKSNLKNLEIIEHQERDFNVNSSHVKEEQEIAKQHVGETNSSDNQQKSEPKLPDSPDQVKNCEEICCSQESDSNNKNLSNGVHHAAEDINGTENINNLSKSEISAQKNTKEFEEAGDSTEFDNKCLVSSLEENSFKNQNQPSKIIEDKEESFQENTEESGETGDSKDVEKLSYENKFISTIDKDKQIAVPENCEESQETGESTEELEAPQKNQIQSTTSEVKQIFQENIEESEITNVSRQAEEDFHKHRSQSTEVENKQISVQEDTEESKKTCDSKPAIDSYENQVPSPDNEDKLSELSDSNILHGVDNVESNSSAPNEEQSKIQEQQEDKSNLQESSGTNILNLQEHFTNSDPCNITYQNNSIEYILEIEERAKKFDDKVAKYSGTNYSVDYFVIDENLTRLVECLDKVKLQQDEDLLKEKIRVIDYIRSLQLRLDENVTEK